MSDEPESVTIEGVEVKAGDPVRVTGLGRGPNDSSYEWVFQGVTVADGETLYRLFGGRTNAGARSRIAFIKYFPPDRVLPPNAKQRKTMADQLRRQEAADAAKARKEQDPDV